MGQFNAELGGDDVHASLADRIPQQGRHASDTGELDVSTLAGNEHDLLVLAFTDEIQEGVDDVDVAEQVCFHLSLVNFCYCSVVGSRIIHCHKSPCPARPPCHDWIVSAI